MELKRRKRIGVKKTVRWKKRLVERRSRKERRRRKEGCRMEDRRRKEGKRGWRNTMDELPEWKKDWLEDASVEGR